MDRQSVLNQLLQNKKYEEMKQAIDIFQQIDDYQAKISECQAQLNHLLSIVTPTDMSLNKLAKGLRFTRKLSGATVGDDYILEKDLRKMDVIPQTGDLVKYNDQQELEIVDACGKPNPDLVAFDKVIVKYNPSINRYYFNRYANGDRLTLENDGIDLVLINSDADVASGDIIEYAFYNAPNKPIAENATKGIVRWKYETEDLIPNTSNKPVKHEKKEATMSGKITKLDMDLEGKSVLIITSMVDAEHKLTSAIDKYHPAKITFTGDEHTGASLDYQRLVEGYDVVIICTDLIRHHTSQGLMDYLRTDDQTVYAVAATSTAHNIERALYRAVNGLPAFENGGSMFDYPIVETKVD